MVSREQMTFIAALQLRFIGISFAYAKWCLLLSVIIAFIYNI